MTFHESGYINVNENGISLANDLFNRVDNRSSAFLIKKRKKKLILGFRYWSAKRVASFIVIIGIDQYCGRKLADGNVDLSRSLKYLCCKIALAIIRRDGS